MINPAILQQIGKGAATKGAKTGAGGANILSLASQFVKPGEDGRDSVFGSTLKGAAKGAELGSTFGPLGTGIGAGVGALAGLFIGKDQAYKAQQEETRKSNAALEAAKQSGANFAATNPEEIYGNKYASYFKRGGKLKSYANGSPSNVKSVSNGAIIEGPSHEEGGVQIGDAEVEGDETLAQGEDGTYVMSKMGGIANTHKKLLSSISKIERKPMTPERVNALTRLRNRENLLIKFQQSINGNA
jgi:gas vesicle protein